MDDKSPSPQTYAALFASIKQRIQTAQVRASLAVNRELVLLYWGIGKEILARQQEEGWGTKVIDTLAAVLERDRDLLRRLRERGMTYARECLTWEAKATATTQVLNWTVGRGPKPDLPWSKMARVKSGTEVEEASHYDTGVSYSAVGQR
jgi:hypothetical protein